MAIKRLISIKKQDFENKRLSSTSRMIKKLVTATLNWRVFFMLAIILAPVLLAPLKKTSLAQTRQTTNTNSQNITILTSPLSRDLPKAQGGNATDVLISDNSLVPQMGPSGSSVDNFLSSTDKITTYIVRDGDSLGVIAEMFDISANTIRWQNDLKHKDVIHPGDKLIILPVDGIEHIVHKGDSIASIAKKYSGYQEEIRQFNDLDINTKLKIGMNIIIPGGEPIQSKVVIAKKTQQKTSSQKTSNKKSVNSSYYTHPLAGRGIKTQNYHGRWRGVDIGAPIGTPVVASAPGKVIVINNSGWGGGYGHYIILSHPNGSKTLYGHNSKNIVHLGQYVQRGEKIAELGSTGRSTGPHIHFEIRNGIDVPCASWGIGACH